MALAWGFTRTQLIDAVVAGLIAGSTAAGARVYKARTSDMSPNAGDVFPAILVWSGQSSDQNILDACTTPAEYEKTWSFTVDLRIVLGASVTDAVLDEALDTLEEQVRAILLGGVTWSTGLDQFEQITSVSAFYADHTNGSDGKSTQAALTFTLTSMIKYG
jgi:hypothetical protein